MHASVIGCIVVDAVVVVVAVVLSVAELEVSLFSVVVVASINKKYFCFVMKKVQNSTGTNYLP